MKKSRFTDEQIAFASKQAERGTPLEEVCMIGISDAAFLNDQTLNCYCYPAILCLLDS